MKNIWKSFLALIIIASNAHAEIGDLVLSGNITNHNYGKQYLFKKSDITKMKQHKIVTGTSWTPVSTFEGVKISDLLAKVGANGTILSMHAINDYEVDIPVSDINNYQPILATKINGISLTVRDYGPYFVIYPIDTYKDELDRPKYLARFIWQVDKIMVK